MAVPGYQEMFSPFLQFLADGKPHEMTEIREHIENYLGLSDEERGELIPSGSATRSANRVGWCRTHLAKAGLIEKMDWGIYRITEAGKKVVANPPSKFDLKFLDTIPKHQAWFHAPKKEIPARAETSPDEAQPPNERIEEAFGQLNESLASDLRDHMAKMDPFRFEQLVVDLLFAMGYGGSREEAAKVTKKSNDEGIDGVINEDRLGLDVIYVQAKRWQNAVGRREIQSFVGALAGQQANKRVFITTGDFNQGAIDYAKAVSQKVILIHGARLAELMIEHNVGVSTVRTLSLKRIDSDYFEES
jgi:restriction system protein